MEKIKTYLKFISRQPRGMVYGTPKKCRTQQAEGQAASTCGTISGSLSNCVRISNLKAQCQDCTKCPLATQGRSNVVFGHGNPEATLMFVGEGPGRDEDLQALPFVGRAGKLLTKIIEAMGLKREDVYISNVVKCRPPGNRAPLPNESDTCKNLILFREIAIIRPKVICTLGATATQGLLPEVAQPSGRPIGITKLRGRFFELSAPAETLQAENIYGAAGGSLEGNKPKKDGICQKPVVMPTFHPAYLLRNGTKKKEVWEDMQKIMSYLSK